VVISLFKALKLFQGRLRMSQCHIVASLATTSRADEHQAVTNKSRVVELDNLVDERFNRLKVLLPTTLGNLRNQGFVDSVGLLNTREEI
jgi:hypothetical protein